MASMIKSSHLLNDILKQYPDKIMSTIQQLAIETLESTEKILVFGAGDNGKRVASLMVSAGYPLLGFIDDTPVKQGSILNGLPIFSVESAVEAFGNEVLIIISIFHPFHSFRKTRERFHTYGWHSISFLNIGMLFSKEFLPFYFLDHPEVVLKHTHSYQRLNDLLIDERSKNELTAHLYFRLHLDFNGLPEPIGPNFSYLKNRLPPDIVFVDGGAFDGDTVRGFLDLVNENFTRIFAFEPDFSNFAKLKAFHQSLPSSLKEKIYVMNAGLWSKNNCLGFQTTATAGSCLSPEASNKINVFSVDESIQTESLILLKLDVEGAERDALYGAKKILQEGRAIVVVAAYHQPDDLWSLPELILAFNSGYSFGLRSHGDDGADLMLYAFPPGTI